ncbi:MAG: hypothetical protein ACK5LV_11220 [Lachnospirales bacterium]
MKANIKQLLDSVILDNEEFIRDYSEDGNIKEYLLGCADAEGIYWYLTDEEITQLENNINVDEIYDEVYALFDEYDYSVDE